GMGSDGHTASLFPGSPALEARDRLIAINQGPSVTPPDRVTMTYPLLNASRFIGVMVTGAGKRPTLAKIAARQASARELPILGIRPLAGEMRWYIDQAACPTAGPTTPTTSDGSRADSDQPRPDEAERP